MWEYEMEFEYSNFTEFKYIWFEALHIAKQRENSLWKVIFRGHRAQQTCTYSIIGGQV